VAALIVCRVPAAAHPRVRALDRATRAR